MAQLIVSEILTQLTVNMTWCLSHPSMHGMGATSSKPYQTTDILYHEIRCLRRSYP